VNQLLRRAAAAAAMRRERNSSCHSDDLQMKRHRPDSGMMGPNINNNNLDILNHMPQITATDFSTNIKQHINSISPHIKDSDRMDVKTPNSKIHPHDLMGQFKLSFLMFCKLYSYIY
jgi:broad-complex core protein